MKSRYNIVLCNCEEQNSVLETECCDMEVYDTLDALEGLVCMMLTEEEAEELRASDRIMEVEKEDVPIETYTVRTDVDFNYLTRYGITSQNGADITSTFKFLSSDQEISGNTGPIGYFQISPFNEDAYLPDQNITRNYAGEYVDIVAIEAGEPVAANDVWEDHPDSQDDATPTTNTRFVRMDWSDISSSVNDPRNNQVTNSNRFSDHAIGVMSTAAGKTCGWAAVSSIRVIYLSDGVTTVHNAVLSWHQTKPVNPVTGRRNATIVTGAWGYGGEDHNYMYRVKDINEIGSYDDDGMLTTVQRPVGGWGSDLTPFVNAGLMPRIAYDQTTAQNEWWISCPAQTSSSSYNSMLTNWKSDGSIYYFKSAGNFGGAQSVKDGDPRLNDYIKMDANIDVIQPTTDSQGQYVFSRSNNPTQDLQRYTKTYRTVGSLNHYSIGACHHSTINPVPDPYSNRGPHIDIWAFGAYTWASAGGTGRGNYTLPDGEWDYFSGTSCAAPVAAGAAALFVDYHFDTFGEYPTHQQLLDYMQKNGKEVMLDLPPTTSTSAADALARTNEFDYSNAGVTPPSALYGPRTYNVVSTYNRIEEGQYENGGNEVMELWGSTTKRIFVPYFVTRNTKQRASSAFRSNFHYNNYNDTKQSYPRRKKRIG